MFGWVPTRRGVGRRLAMRAATMTLVALLATLGLGACGTATQTQLGGGATSGGMSIGTPRVGSIPSGGMAVRPCPGLVGDATQVGSIALTLTQGHTAGSLHTGELAQVRLPAALHWTLASQPANLASVGEAGGQDTTLNVCYWTFRAQSAGSATLHFSGMQPCDPSAGACSNVIVAQSFTITVV